jgi:hypothetical protein
MDDLTLGEEVDVAVSDEIVLSIVFAVIVLIVLLTWLVSVRFLWGFLALWLIYVGYLTWCHIKSRRTPPTS